MGPLVACGEQLLGEKWDVSEAGNASPASKGSRVVQERGSGAWPGWGRGARADSLLMVGLGGKPTPSLWPQELAWFAYWGGERERKRCGWAPGAELSGGAAAASLSEHQALQPSKEEAPCRRGPAGPAEATGPGGSELLAPASQPAPAAPTDLGNPEPVLVWNPGTTVCAPWSWFPGVEEAAR